MKRFELEVEHHYKNKFIGRHRVKTTDKMFVLGQSRDANIRLLGDDVNPIHAIVEFKEDSWSLMDTGSESGTWIKKKPITSETLDEETVATIGGHQLKFVPRVIEGSLFKEEKGKDKTASGTKRFHQIIQRRGDVVISTELLPAKESYIFNYAGKSHVLPPPKEGDWATDIFGETQVIRRIARAEEMSTAPKDRWRILLMPEMRIPIGVALSMLFVFVVLVALAPHKPDAELNAPPIDNKFTRMIYDAEMLKAKREEARERKQVLAKKAGANPNAGAGEGKDPQTTPVKSAGKQQKVVSNIKLQGLSNLLGKISKRANSSGLQIITQGLSPDRKDAGRSTVAAAGTLQGVETKVGNGGTTFKVGGVGTFGKGGGTGGAVGTVGSLGAANIGNASVGVLEEETEIEGGLDKDVIARIIRNQLGEIRYCYERQLSADPDIYGKVLVKFRIDPSGTVMDQRIGLTTLRSANVEGCILRRMARWKFPKPKGGTHVLVSYPFLFKATN